MKLTKDTIRDLEAPAGKSEVIYFDDELERFGLRIRSGGKRTWIVQYRRRNGKSTKSTIGDASTLDVDRARKEAKKRLAQHTLGGDPQADKAAERARSALTLGAKLDNYLEYYASKERRGKKLHDRTREETERYLRDHWKPLHGERLDHITRKDVAGRLAVIKRQNGPVAAARARVALSGFFSWAIGEGFADANPVIGTNKPAEPEARDRVLLNEEIADVWAACRDDEYGRIVKLALLTGTRRDEVGGMTWEEVDLSRGTWSIPGERTKNGRPHMLPLAATTVEIIQSIPKREKRKRLFGEGEGSFSGWSKAKTALDKRILDARQKTAGEGATVKPMKDWRLHDLRRTCATIMADRLGVLPHVIEAVLNHVSGHKAGVAGVYNRALYEREMREALTRWADYVRAIVDGSAHKVVTLHGGQSKFPA
jgi:integrase